MLVLKEVLILFLKTYLIYVSPTETNEIDEMYFRRIKYISFN